MNILKPLTLALALTFSAGTLVAQDLNKGAVAYQAGDYPTALQEWRPLAEQGDARAQIMLGNMYRKGIGVLQDYAEALKWYRLSAEQGNAIAQSALGTMADSGEGVPQDYAEAMKWYRMAAEQGNAPAQGLLGAMYALGQGVLEDKQTAHMWFNIAAANGNEQGSEGRDEVTKRMTTASIEEAQRRARVCMASNYQDCD